MGQSKQRLWVYSLPCSPGISGMQSLGHHCKGTAQRWGRLRERFLCLIFFPVIVYQTLKVSWLSIPEAHASQVPSMTTAWGIAMTWLVEGSEWRRVPHELQKPFLARLCLRLCYLSERVSRRKGSKRGFQGQCKGWLSRVLGGGVPSGNWEPWLYTLCGLAL